LMIHPSRKIMETASKTASFFSDYCLFPYTEKAEGSRGDIGDDRVTQGL